MSYVKDFKKFLKQEEKKVAELGANPSVEEQATAAEPAAQTPAQTPEQPAAPVGGASVESDAAVQSARAAVATATANRDKVVAAKEKELNDLKAQQDALVNTATTALNTALATASEKMASPAK